MSYHLARLGLGGQLSLSNSDILSRGDDFLHQAYADDFNSLAPRKSSFLETYVGVATLVILRVLQTPNAQRASSKVASATEWRPAARLLREMTNLIAQEDRQKMSPGSSVLDDADAEVLYGRAGFLYALLLLRSARREFEADTSEIAIAVDGLVSDASIKTVFDSIIGRGFVGAETYTHDVHDSGLRPALMWTWHGKRYLGGAHGVGMTYFKPCHSLKCTNGVSWNPSHAPFVSTQHRRIPISGNSSNRRVAHRPSRCEWKLAEQRSQTELEARSSGK
jgi:hypothetical protein